MSIQLRREIKKLCSLIAVCLLLTYAQVVGASPNENREKAIFAGGCFWCMEPPFDKLKGVESTVSGYIGGSKINPTYEEVSAGKTGHIEAVEITFDPSKISYEDLLKVFWRQIEPTDDGGQFVDRGEQYTSAIFYLNETQKTIAEKSKTELQASGKFKTPIKTKIRQATKFYAAEDYHQDYYLKNTVRYKYYRYRSGRDEYLDKVWGKDRENKALLKAKP